MEKATNIKKEDEDSVWLWLREEKLFFNLFKTWNPNECHYLSQINIQK